MVEGVSSGPLLMIAVGIILLLPELANLANGAHGGYKFILQGTNEGYQITATPEKVGGTGTQRPGRRSHGGRELK